MYEPYPTKERTNSIQFLFLFFIAFCCVFGVLFFSEFALFFFFFFFLNECLTVCERPYCVLSVVAAVLLSFSFLCSIHTRYTLRICLVLTRMNRLFNAIFTGADDGADPAARRNVCFSFFIFLLFLSFLVSSAEEVCSCIAALRSLLFMLLANSSSMNAACFWISWFLT